MKKKKGLSGSEESIQAGTAGTARSLAVIIAYTVFLAALMLLVAEGTARLIFDEDQGGLFADPGLQRRGRHYITGHPERGFALQPGYSHDLLNVNSEGFRGAEFPDDFASLTRVLVVGESSTFGWKVGDDQTVPALMAASFREQGLENVYVVNGGVTAYTSSQVLIYLEEILATGRVAPEVTVINVMWNDLWYAATVNWYPELLIFQQPARWRTALINRSLLYRKLVFREPTFTEHFDLFNERAFAHYLKNMKAMMDTCRRHGTEPVIVQPAFTPELVPAEGVGLFRTWYSRDGITRLYERYTAALRDLAADQEVSFLSTSLTSNSRAARGLYMDFTHLTAEGNGAFARDIVTFLKEADLVN